MTTLEPIESAILQGFMVGSKEEIARFVATNSYYLGGKDPRNRTWFKKIANL